MTILTVPNEFKFDNSKGLNDFSSDTYKLILMVPAFSFNKDTHGTYSDVSASEITSAGGYAAVTLTTKTAWNQNDTDDIGEIEWNNVTFSASGADFDDFGSAIIYNDDHASDLIVGCIDFETTISLPNGNSFQLQTLGFNAA